MGKWTHAKTIWTAAVIILLLVLVIIVRTPQGSPAPSVALTPTQTEAPADVTVPSEGSTSVSADVAVPAVQTAASPNGDASFRSFAIKISNNTYTPNTVIANQGDTINIKMTAIDKDYTFNQPDYGMSSVIPQGKTQTIQFEASQSGKFTFYCGSCGGPTKGPVGYIIIAAKAK